VAQATLPPLQVQARAAQDWVGPQARLQAPQFPRSVARSAQTPGVAPQVVSPGGQAQSAAVHVAPVAQRVAHAPQLATSVCLSTQAPGAVPQVSGAAAGHWHTPAAQLAPVGQAWPQAPQWCRSVCLSTQAPGVVPQVSGAAAGHWQTPVAQLAPDGQLFRHAPQLAGSLEAATQSGPGAAQAVAPTSHSHPVAPQLPTPQATPQALQFTGSLARLAQVPGGAPQAVSPAGQAQPPATQLAPAAQRFRQVPQERALVCRSKQMPPQAVWPAGQVSGLVPPEQPMATAAAMAATVAARVRRVGGVMWADHSPAHGARAGRADGLLGGARRYGPPTRHASHRLIGARMRHVPAVCLAAIASLLTLAAGCGSSASSSGPSIDRTVGLACTTKTQCDVTGGGHNACSSTSLPVYPAPVCIGLSCTLGSGYCTGACTGDVDCPGRFCQVETGPCVSARAT
jgi:hypothetical protein